MPEYLAPGVYVEETSFRSKSIEGVGTSTTAFVGPTLKGPADVTPDLITSFADFERLYGGLADLAPGRPNYLAHAVKVFFDNGGSRLYVSRVVPGNATKGQSADLLPAALDPAAPQLRFQARFPGPGGNGVIEVVEKDTPVSRDNLAKAPVGSLLRLGGEQVATPAQVTGTQAPLFTLPNEGVFFLAVNGAESVLTFRGRPAEVSATADLPDPLNLPAGASLEVRIGDGVAQRLMLPVGNLADANVLLAAINQQLRGGYARLQGARLVLGTDQRGSGARLQVMGGPAELNRPTALQSNTADANNTVADLAAVSLAEINGLLPTGANGVKALIVNGNLALRTTGTGSNQKLRIRDRASNAATPDPLSVHGLLGLPANSADVRGTEGETQSLYRLTSTGEWRDLRENLINLNQDPFPTANLLSLTLLVRSGDGVQTVVEDLGYSPDHPRWIGAVLKSKPDRRSEDLSNPVALIATNPQNLNQVNGLVLRNQLLSLARASGASDALTIAIENGTAGAEPTAADYEKALEPLMALEEISIVAAPGHSTHSDATMFAGIQQVLLTFVSRPRAYQIAVLDPPRGSSDNEVRGVRSRIDSSKAALYYPWVVVANPLYRPGDARQPAEISLPPSGFLCGIYGRNDSQRGVFKAPANEVVLGALRFERDINSAQQEVLNPLGINCLRFFPGRGYRVWGARTASSDPEFKYVNVRRYFNYLEASIDRSTQWAVFEPNSERLWGNIRDTLSSFLYNEWVSGALLGSSMQEAYFVRCDRSTMTQNDLDNGRLICLIGVAVVKPAEFVIFRIGQKTADART
jgi:phage tail sheath protein FI